MLVDIFHAQDPAITGAKLIFYLFINTKYGKLSSLSQ